MTLSLARIADLVGGKVVGESTMEILGVAPFDDAVKEDITFAANAKYLKKINRTNAGAVIVPNDFESPDKNLILTENPLVAFAKVIEAFHPKKTQKPGIHEAAWLGENFVCGEDPAVAPFVVIQDNVTLGDRVTLHPHVFIGEGVSIGDDVEILPNVSILDRCKIGSRVIIHAGTVVGSDGFGFAPDKDTYHKIPQIGIVQIDDDVEIGACNTIDRATFGKTWVQRGVKTDNLIQIAHNVTVGEDSVLVAQVGISGSVTIGKHVTIAGQAGIAGHFTIGDNATIGPQAGISRDIEDGETVLGAPGFPYLQYIKSQKLVQRLPELKKKIDTMERQLKALNRLSGRTESVGDKQ
jgi:UDP-3-O-[3-hydroxymyristoyl] glucosamine N-acyltransferase